MGNVFYFEWESALMQALQSHMGAAAVAAASFFTMFGEELVLILLLGYFYWCYDKAYGRAIGCTAVIGNVFIPTIKNVALRRRPYFDVEAIQCLKLVDASADALDISAQGFSFPSGHSMNAAVIYGTLARLFKKKPVTIAAFVLIGLVGLSRVMLGVHWPTDVLVGWSVGAVLVFLVPRIEAGAKNRYLLHAVIVLISLTGCFFCRTTDYYTSLGIMIGFYLGDAFEEKYVRFSTTRSIPVSVARVAGGLVVYLALNTILKLPFPAEFLAGQTMAAFLVRTVRHTIVVFIMIGVYPLLFRRFRGLGGKKEEES